LDLSTIVGLDLTVSQTIYAYITYSGGTVYSSPITYSPPTVTMVEINGLYVYGSFIANGYDISEAGFSITGSNKDGGASSIDTPFSMELSVIFNPYEVGVIRNIYAYIVYNGITVYSSNFITYTIYAPTVSSSSLDGSLLSFDILNPSSVDITISIGDNSNEYNNFVVYSSPVDIVGTIFDDGVYTYDLRVRISYDNGYGVTNYAYGTDYHTYGPPPPPS